MSKKDDDKKDHQHSGSVAAEDEELTRWLHKLWSRNELPERLELWPVFGRNLDVRGEMIHHEDFQHGKKYNVEEANKLANEILSVAQHDCDSRRNKKEMTYQLAIIDRNRRASPLVRLVGPVQPKRNYAVALAAARAADGDADDDDLDIKNIELRRIKHSADEVRWDKTRNDRVLGDVLLLMRDLLLEERKRTQHLEASHMDFFNRLQDAEDRKVQRELMLQREQFKFDLMKEGLKSARNLLPGLFADRGQTHQQQHLNSGGQGSAKRTYGTSPERALVDNFLSDCEEKKLDIVLFGDYADVDGKLQQVREGIFTVKQFGVMWGVREGRLPVDALDNLMPKSGHEIAITEEQIQHALAAGVTESMGVALFELIGLRNKAREAREAAVHQSRVQQQASEATT